MTRRMLAGEADPPPLRGRGSRSGSAGFLLAETLITFAISALVLVGLVTSATVLLRATDRSVAAVGGADALGRTLAALTRDVSALKRARWSGEEPQGFVFRGGPNSLSFAQEVPDGDGRELRVISLREVALGRGTALMRSEAHLPATATGWPSLAFGTAHPVPTGPARLRFRYVAERTAGEPPPRPADSWPSGRTLPAAVIVEAVDAATTRLLVAATIPVRADGDIGCADRTRRDPSAGTPAPIPSGPAPGGMAMGGPASGGPASAAPPPAPAGTEAVADTANVNEFCGRTDKGLAPRPAGQPAPSPLASAAPFGGPR